MSILKISQSLEILNFTNLGFVVFSCLVGVSLIFALTNKNLIYSVLNLGLLSLFLILMWMYYLEVNFILIVYILAFIGAIVMLFLSVVLMLPSSTFSSQSSALLLFGLGFEEILHYLSKNFVYYTVCNFLGVAIAVFVILVGAELIMEIIKVAYLIFKRFIANFDKNRVLTSTKNWTASNWKLLKAEIKDLRRVSFRGITAEIRPDMVGIASILRERVRNYSLPVFDFVGQLVYKLLFISLVAFMPQNTINVLPRSHSIYSENLLAIKSVLYVEQPLLLIMSVIGLLIALFGVTAVVMPDRKATAVNQ